MALADDIDVHARAKEVLSKPVPPLGSVREMVEYAIYRKALFRERRLLAWALIEHIGMRLGLDDLQGQQCGPIDEPVTLIRDSLKHETKTYIVPFRPNISTDLTRNASELLYPKLGSVARRLCR